MTIEHKNIADGQRHEPKGISTAVTDSVYKADGSGSGTWSPISLQGQALAELGQVAKSLGNGSVVWKHIPSGWAYYQQGTGTQAFTTAYSKLIIDSLNAGTTEAYLPYDIRGTGSLWDEINSKITPISVGDSYDIRLDLNVTAESGTPTEVTVQLDIGSGAGPTAPIVTKYEKTGRTVPYNFTVTFPIFCLNDFKTNGGQFFIKTDAGSVTVTNRAISIIRTSAGDF